MATYKFTGRIYFENGETRTVDGDTMVCEYGTTSEVIKQYLVRWALVMGQVADDWTLDVALVTLG